MQTAILFPVFAQIGLTLAVAFAAFYARARALQGRQVRIADIALDNANWPDHVRQLGNSYSNQFELPVIFYVLCLVASITSMADLFTLALAWAFVASRGVHALIHCTNNRVTRRGLAFLLGVILVGVMAIYLFLRLLAASL